MDGFPRGRENKMTPSNPVRPRRTIVRDSARPAPVQCANRECTRRLRDLERKYRELNRVYWDEQRGHLERLESLKKLEEENEHMRKEVNRIEDEMAGLRFEMNNVIFNLEHQRREMDELENENRALANENIELFEQLSAYEALTPAKMDYSARLLAGIINGDQPTMFYKPRDGEDLPEFCPICMSADEGRFVFSFVCGFRHAICLDCFLKIVMDGRNFNCPVCKAKYVPGELSTIVIEKK